MSNEVSESFSIKKLALSPFTGLYWIKVIMFGLGLSALFFIGYGVHKAYFKKPLPTNTQTAKEIVNNTYNYPAEKEKFFLGINIKGWRFGLSK